MSDLAMKTVHELAPMIERREVSPVELTREALDRIKSLDERLHTFITVRGEQALADAQRAESEIAQGKYRGPFHGVPMGIKDNIAVSGWPTTNASLLMTDFITDYDATVVERLRGAGAVIVGKTNLHEWAMGSTSDGPLGTTHNPWDESRVPGGSSGGSAAAVSASLIYGSVGTDGRGSIRMPSAYCGVVGLKPTYGLVSRFGELPPTSSNNDHLGPIAKDVRDAATMLNVLAGHDPNDPTSIPSKAKDYTADLGRGVAGLKVGVPLNFFFEQATTEMRTLVMKAVETLASLGAEIREARAPSLEYFPLASTTSVNEAASFLLPFARKGPSAFGDQSIWERVVVGQLLSKDQISRGARLINLIRQEFLSLMEQVDILAMPTTISQAFPITGARDREADKATALTSPFNFLGMPAISVPCGFASDGLPVGLMLAGRHWEDELVLRVAYAYEQATSGGYVAPAIATSGNK